MKKKLKNSKNVNGSYTDKLITSRNSKSPVSEAFRAIRTNIEFSDIDKNIKTIVATSSIQGEGKSVVTANLAVTMAMAGKKVLLIDADLRNPTMHKVFNIHNNIGITNLLLHDSLALEEVLITPKANLFLLPSGPLPPNPAELLGSIKMRELLSSLEKIFDFILLDAPPVLAVTDASILASYLDGVIIVAGSGQTSKDQAVAAKEQLLKVKANILGVILNKVPQSEGGYYYSYHYGDSK